MVLTKQAVPGCRKNQALFQIAGINRNILSPLTVLKINNCDIEKADTIKVIVLLDDNLSWKEHIKYI